MSAHLVWHNQGDLALFGYDKQLLCNKLVPLESSRKLLKFLP